MDMAGAHNAMMNAAQAAGDDDMDDAYKKAMQRLAELKQRPVESLNDTERKEKLRLANRESARKMRRKQSDTLTAAEKRVKHLEAENVAHMNKLAEGWYKYKEIRAENDLLRTELQTLQTYPNPDGSDSAHIAPASDVPEPAADMGYEEKPDVNHEAHGDSEATE